MRVIVQHHDENNDNVAQPRPETQQPANEEATSVRDNDTIRTPSTVYPRREDDSNSSSSPVNSPASTGSIPSITTNNTQAPTTPQEFGPPSPGEKRTRSFSQEGGVELDQRSEIELKRPSPSHSEQSDCRDFLLPVAVTNAPDSVEDQSGYTVPPSLKEYGPLRKAQPDAEVVSLETLLKEIRGFCMKRMAADGNCLFRAISDQIYGDQEMHAVARQLCMDYMVAEREHFSQFTTEDFEDYIERKRKDKIFGNNMEIQAFAEIFNRPIEVYTLQSGDVPMNIFQSSYETDNAPIRLSYHHGNHYNSVTDPKNPSVGVGLGLPGYDPRQPERHQIQTILRDSENDILEQALIEESQKESDWKRTEEDLEQAVIAASMRERSLQQQASRKHGHGIGGGPSSAAGPSLHLEGDLPPTVQKLLSIGFAVEECMQAYSIFGDDMDNILCYLTAETR